MADSDSTPGAVTLPEAALREAVEQAGGRQRIAAAVTGALRMLEVARDDFVRRLAPTPDRWYALQDLDAAVAATRRAVETLEEADA